MIHLRGDDDVFAQGGLVRLGAKPGDSLFLGHAGSADHHLGGAGQDIRSVGDVRGRSLSRKRHITERLDVVDVHLDVRVHRSDTGCETIDVELRVADLDRADNANHARLVERSSDGAVDETALIGTHGVGKDVIETEVVGRCSPRKRHVRIVGGDLLERTAVLRAVSDHQIEAIFGVAADCGRCVLDDEGPVGDVHVDFSRHIGDAVDHRLAERQVVARRRSNDRHAERAVGGRAAACLGFVVVTATRGQHGEGCEQYEQPRPSFVIHCFPSSGSADGSARSVERSVLMRIDRTAWSTQPVVQTGG